MERIPQSQPRYEYRVKCVISNQKQVTVESEASMTRVEGDDAPVAAVGHVERAVPRRDSQPVRVAQLAIARAVRAGHAEERAIGEREFLDAAILRRAQRARMQATLVGVASRWSDKSTIKKASAAGRAAAGVVHART